MSQEQVDQAYDYFCHILKSEMDQYLNFNEMGPNTRKRWKHSKPYWNNHLTQLWKILKTKEHTFTRAKRNNRDKNRCFTEFKNARHEFDKTLRKYERNYYN